jgi:hypothetical protein
VDTDTDQAAGLIRKRSHAVTAVLCTLVVFASNIRGSIRHTPHYERWLFIEPLPQWHQFRPLFIGFTIWVWVFVLWILFWFYRAARGKYERFLVAAYAVSFVLSTVEPFVPREAATDLQIATTGASLLALAAALILFLQIEKITHGVETEDHLR